jgi:hypothetical protein
MKMTPEILETLRDQVRKYFEQNWESCKVPSEFTIMEETREHILNISCSIIMTKYEIGSPGGGFVHAIVNNDLRGAVNRADAVNLKMIPFYVTMLENLPVYIDEMGNEDADI